MSDDQGLRYEHCEACGALGRYVVETKHRYAGIDVLSGEDQPNPIRLRVCERCALATGEDVTA